MRQYYFALFLLPLLSLAQTEIRVLPEPKGAEDFEHNNPGCPENSECDPVMGHQMRGWKTLTKRLALLPPQKSAEASRELEEFRKSRGIPVEFYTNKKSQQGFRPLFFHSHCREHNPKVQENRILKGVAFLKGLSSEKATVWRDQTQIEVPVGELLIPQPVIAYFPSGKTTYALPIDDQPLFIRDKALHVLREEEGFFFVLRVTSEGEWSIPTVDLTNLSSWEDKRESTACPVAKDEKKPPKEFNLSFCKSIWNEDLKKTVVVKMHVGCQN